MLFCGLARSFVDLYRGPGLGVIHIRRRVVKCLDRTDSDIFDVLNPGAEIEADKRASEPSHISLVEGCIGFVNMLSDI